MNGRKKLIIGGAVAGGSMLLAAGLVIGAGIARADYVDDYVAALVRDGVAYDPHATFGIAIVCDEHLLDGESVYQTARYITGYFGSAFRFNDAYAMTVDAWTYLCPEALVPGGPTVAAAPPAPVVAIA